MTVPAIPARLQCQGYPKNKKWGYVRRCDCVGTVRIGGKLYCLGCARKAKEPK